jgi:hypothetical protein
MRCPLRIKRSNIVKYVAPIYSDTTWAALPPEEAVSTSRRGSFSPI